MTNHVVLSQDGLSVVPEKNTSRPKASLKTYSPLCRISHNGFTLLELLISLAIIGMIAVIVTNALRLSSHTVSTGEKRIESLERTRTSLHIIDSQIQSQIPLTYEDDDEKKYYFQGERESVQFPSSYSLWGGQRGYVLVRYAVRPDETGKQMLSISETIMGTGSTRESVLFKAADAIYFEYFLKDPTEEKGEWVDRWRDTGNIPEKIKLHLVQGRKDLLFVIPMRTAGPLRETVAKKSGDTETPPVKIR